MPGVSGRNLCVRTQIFFPDGGGGGVNVFGGGVERFPPSDGFVVWLALSFAMESKMVAMVIQSFCGQVSTFRS